MDETNTKTMGKRGMKILRVVLALALAAVILLGVLNAIMVGFIDFPCFVEYQSEGNCLANSASGSRWAPPEADTRIEAFMTTYIAGWSGGGCDYQPSQSDSLSLRSSVGGIELTRQGDELLVNGKILAGGEMYKRANWFDWHPWIVPKIQFLNAGVIADCQGEAAVERLVIIGRYGTQTSPLKGSLIILVLVAGLVYLQIAIRRGK